MRVRCFQALCLDAATANSKAFGGVVLTHQARGPVPLPAKNAQLCQRLAVRRRPRTRRLALGGRARALHFACVCFWWAVYLL